MVIYAVIDPYLIIVLNYRRDCSNGALGASIFKPRRRYLRNEGPREFFNEPTTVRLYR